MAGSRSQLSGDWILSTAWVADWASLFWWKASKARCNVTSRENVNTKWVHLELARLVDLGNLQEAETLREDVLDRSTREMLT